LSTFYVEDFQTYSKKKKRDWRLGAVCDIAIPIKVRRQWLRPVIPAIQKAERSGRSLFEANLGK
jgi:hypothetical protein